MAILFKELIEQDLLIGFDHEIGAAFDKQIEHSFTVGGIAPFAEGSPYSLRGIRLRKEVTQRQAARLLKLSQSKLSRLENGVLLPTKRELNNIFEMFSVDIEGFAKAMEQAIREGDLVTPPIYALANRNFQMRSEGDRNLILELTNIQWRNQCGVPIDFKTARYALGIRNYAYDQTTMFTKDEQMRIEGDTLKAIDAIHIIYAAIAYRISPLSLVNGILLRTLGRSNMVLGGKLRAVTGYNHSNQPLYSNAPNEAFFTSLKDLIVRLGLIPEWQVSMWQSLMLSVMSNYTREAHGINKYIPFPLTPKNYREWISDPILSLYQPDTPPTDEFWYTLGVRLPHDTFENRSVPEFHHWVINKPKAHQDWISKVMKDEG